MDQRRNRRRYKKYLENNNRKTTVQNIWDLAKAVLNEKFITIQAYQETRKISNNHF